MFNDPTPQQRHKRRLRLATRELMSKGFEHIVHLKDSPADADGWATEQFSNDNFGRLYDVDYKIEGDMYGFKTPEAAFHFKMRWA
jgi:hypothetical protein